MKNIIILKDSTYSPLALYFLLDNNLLNDRSETNKYFDILINDSSLDKEVLNLIILKKGLYNSNYASESELLAIFNPLITSENIWRSHALYLIAEYFYSKNEMQKSKEFFEKILELKNSNPQIKSEAQKDYKEILVYKFLFKILIIIFLNQCSLDTKTGLWTKPEIPEKQEENLQEIFKSKDVLRKSLIQI